MSSRRCVQSCRYALRKDLLLGGCMRCMGLLSRLANCITQSKNIVQGERCNPARRPTIRAIIPAPTSLRNQTRSVAMALVLLVFDWLPGATCYWSKNGKWIPGNEPEHWHDGHLGEFYKKPREKFGAQ